MDTGFLLIEICMVGFCAILVYIARRDLNAAAAQQRAATLNEAKQLEETIQSLIDVLEEKSQQIEGRIQRRFEELTALEQRTAGQPPHLTMSRGYAPEPPQQTERAGLPVRNGFGDSWRVGNNAPINDEMTPIARALALVDGGANLQTAARIVGVSSLEVETALKARLMRRNKSSADKALQEIRLDT
jgi:hypothetical protein